MTQNVNNSNPRHCFKVITPKMASALLKKTEMLGIRNRKVSDKWVDRFAKEMRDNNWKINGETIAICKEGGVLDGQHRLLACVKAQVPFTTSVIENIDRDSFDTIDCGRPRSASQVLEMQGIKYYNTITSIIRGVAAIKNSKYSNPKTIELSNTDVRAEYDRNCVMYDKVAEIIAPIVQTTKMLSPKMAGSMFVYLVSEMGYEWDYVESFMRGIMDEDTHPNQYINAIRRWLFRQTKTKTSDRVKFGNVVRAWNAMVSNGKVPKFAEDFDEVPSFIHA